MAMRASDTIHLFTAVMVHIPPCVPNTYPIAIGGEYAFCMGGVASVSNYALHSDPTPRGHVVWFLKWSACPTVKKVIPDYKTLGFST